MLQSHVDNDPFTDEISIEHRIFISGIANSVTVDDDKDIMTP